MITKYGTFVVFKCKHCKKIDRVPYHLKNSAPLEKFASYCTHEWEILNDGNAYQEESESIHVGETGSES